MQLENYRRRNSETREPFDEEDQSPSSSSKYDIDAGAMRKKQQNSIVQVEDEGCCGQIQPNKIKTWLEEEKER